MHLAIWLAGYSISSSSDAAGRRKRVAYLLATTAVSGAQLVISLYLGNLGTQYSSDSEWFSGGVRRLSTAAVEPKRTESFLSHASSRTTFTQGRAYTNCTEDKYETKFLCISVSQKLRTGYSFLINGLPTSTLSFPEIAWRKIYLFYVSGLWTWQSLHVSQLVANLSFYSSACYLYHPSFFA